jgi:hypothetical protein
LAFLGDLGFLTPAAFLATFLVPAAFFGFLAAKIE